MDDLQDTKESGSGKQHRVDETYVRVAGRALLLLYENGSCSLCHRKVVKELIAINRLPDWMHDKCQYDAYSETRKLVKSTA